MSWPVLTVTVFLPLVGALFIMSLRGDDAAVQRNARWVALWTTLITFAVSLVLVWRFDASSAEFQFVEKYPWLGGTFTYHMGVDGISLPFVILTTGLLPICIIASFEAIQRRVKEYMIAFLVLETLMVGTFSALDLVLFYLFFEGGLIPMFLIIGVWGGPRRVYASFKFFLYTLLGSVLMLLAIMAMYWSAGTTDITTLLHHEFPRSLQTWAWFAFLASFAVKLPMWPVHTWLPDAHVEAPTAGSVILAAILLENGRLRLPALLAANVPIRVAGFRATDVRAVGGCDHLHLAGRAGAGRYEEAHRLLVGRAYGFRNDGNLCRHYAGGCWRHFPDDFPRIGVGCAVPVRRSCL